jgi:hypothetical protein
LEQLRFFARFKRYFSRQKLLPPPPRETAAATPWPPAPVAASARNAFQSAAFSEPAWMKYPVTPPKGHIIVFANEKKSIFLVYGNNFIYISIIVQTIFTILKLRTCINFFFQI